MYLPLFVLSYVIFRLLYTKYLRIAEYSLILLLSIECIKESCLGLSQIYCGSLTNNPLFSCTGSFSNPGPYGGFLAVCSSLFTAWILDWYCYDKQPNAPINNKRILLVLFNILTIIALMLSLVILPATFSRAAMLSYVCGVAMLLLPLSKFRLIPRRYWTLTFLIVFIMATLAYLYKRTSADSRFFINKISLWTMYENKWHGVGPGYYLGFYSRSQTAYFSTRGITFDRGSLNISPDIENDRILADIPEYAFNEILKTGVECGPLAMLLLTFLFVISITKLIKRRSFLAYGLVSLTVFSLFSYPFSLWTFRLLLSLFIAASAYRECEDPFVKCNRNSLRLTFYTLSFVVIGVSCCISTNRLLHNKKAVREWNLLKYFYTIKEYELVNKYYSPLFSLLENEVQFMYEYGYALNRIGQFEKSDSVLRLGAQRSNNPMFWNLMGNNTLAMGNYREAEDCYKRAFYMVPNRLYPLILLAKLYHTEGDTVRFLNMAEKVETFVPKIESVNTERLRNEIAEIKAGYKTP